MYSLFRNTIFCAILITSGLVLNNDISNVLYIIAIAVGGYKQTLEGIQDSIRNRRINVELLMIFSAIGACILGDMLEGAILIFIFSLAGTLEDATTDRSNRDIRALMELQPEEAHKLVDGNLVVVPVESLVIGDMVVVTTGAAVPVDGKIVKGISAFDESSISGEPLPKEKKEGDNIFAGTINLSGPITLEVTSHPDDILIKKIVKMVAAAKEHQSQTSTFIDKLEGGYAVGVLISVSLVILIPWLFFNVPIDQAAYTGIVLLVVASPCALIASVTPATLAAISNGAKRGILVKGGKYFESLADLKAIAFDKTGTLTTGVPTLTHSEFTLDMTTHYSALRYLEQHSSHPLGKAIVAGLPATDFDETLAVDTMDEVAGFGINGMINGHTYHIGAWDFMETKDPALLTQAQAYLNMGNSVVYVSVDTQCVGFLVITDVIKADAKALIHDLNEKGIKSIMITGDIEQSARHIANEIGITRVIPRCLPDEKMEHIESLKKTYGTVAMVGDGINDAAALANASIGIAMGHGTDIAIESADIILMNQDLENINYGIDLSVKLRKIVKQNIIFSLLVIAVLITLNFTTHLPLPFGVVGHEGSTILVILNSLRMLTPLKNEK